VALRYGFLHRLEHRIHGTRRLGLGHSSPLRHLLSDVAFAEHALPSCVFVPSRVSLGHVRGRAREAVLAAKLALALSAFYSMMVPAEKSRFGAKFSRIFRLPSTIRRSGYAGGQG